MFKEPEGEDWLTEVEDEEYDDWKAACEKGRYVVYSSLAQISTCTLVTILLPLNGNLGVVAS